MPRAERRPWSPFYWADWLADPDVRALTPDERGRYMDVLAYSAQTETPGTMTEERVRVWAGYGLEEWPEHRDRMAGCFDVTGDVWTQGRQKAESAIGKRLNRRLSEAGRRGAAVTNEKRWGSSATTIKVVGAPSARSESQSQSQSEDDSTPLPCLSDSQDPSKTLLSPGATSAWSKRFADFWAAYPHVRGRSHRKPALALWLKLTPRTAAMFERIMAGLEHSRASPDWQKDAGAFVEAAERWIRRHGWDASEGINGESGKCALDMTLEELEEATGRHDLR